MGFLESLETMTTELNRFKEDLEKMNAKINQEGLSTDKKRIVSSSTAEGFSILRSDVKEVEKAKECPEKQFIEDRIKEIIG